MDNPAFSIVVPTFQRRELVCDVVRAIGGIVYSGQVELIVVVDGSDDGTAQALAQMPLPFALRIIEQANCGAAAARNRGAREARGDVLLFLDDDMICDPGVLDAHAASYADGADAVLGDVPLDPGSPPGFLADRVGQWAAQRGRELAAGRAIGIDDLLTGHLSVKRRVFEQLGGFDERFTRGGTFGNEDLDFGLRLLAGHDLRFNGRAVARQRYVVTPAANLRQWYQAGQADVAMARKHPGLAGDLFRAKGAARLPVRFGLRPLARCGALVRWLARRAVRMAQGAGPEARGRARLFFAVRQLVYWAGVHAAGGIPGGRQALVLCYHAVRDLRDDPVLAQYGIPPQQLAGQLDDLRRGGFHFVDPDEFLGALYGKSGLPRRAVLLTFDDGYAELAGVSRDILEPRGIRAMIGAVAGQVGSSNVWDQALGAGELALLDAEGLRALAVAGHEIACHSQSHRALPALAAEERNREVAGARSALEGLGLPAARCFVYPFGENDAPTHQTVRQAGFSAAFGLRRRLASERDDRFNLPRVEILARDIGWRFYLKTRWPRLSSWLLP